jgi:hypothetical protein
MSSPSGGASRLHVLGLTLAVTVGLALAVAGISAVVLWVRTGDPLTILYTQPVPMGTPVPSADNTTPMAASTAGSLTIPDRIPTSNSLPLPVTTGEPTVGQSASPHPLLSPPSPSQTLSSYSARYFTVRVPSDWESPQDMPGSSHGALLESITWRLNGGQAWVYITALDEPYADGLQGFNRTYQQYQQSRNGQTPQPQGTQTTQPLGPGPELLHAGSLEGKIAFSSQTEQETIVSAILPGTSDGGSPIMYQAELELFGPVNSADRDAVARQFRAVMSSLTPTQLALASTPTAVPAPPGVAACPASSLNGTAYWQGATGSMIGAVTFKNTGASACTVHGRPFIEFVSKVGKVAAIDEFPVPPASGNPDTMVVLQHGETALAQVVWRNWCGSSQELSSLRVTMPGTGERIIVSIPVGTARCDVPIAGSGLVVGTFELQHSSP